ncbi:hypothetical protein M2650_15945 [Luteimonas sp. SX5]|uniref:Uncharacterized protein n=1 Tax=Luteimonas galliterrae TaxID=2940486 RepID=A0ABT0MP97_9GAMM|nr:hypothetical protein [Luteimonas galliterrae]MCL1636115.1 hypothetical protein [Luteimonas galliterrae]
MMEEPCSARRAPLIAAAKSRRIGTHAELARLLTLASFGDVGPQDIRPIDAQGQLRKSGRIAAPSQPAAFAGGFVELAFIPVRRNMPAAHAALAPFPGLAGCLSLSANDRIGLLYAPHNVIAFAVVKNVQ